MTSGPRGCWPAGSPARLPAGSPARLPAGSPASLPAGSPASLLARSPAGLLAGLLAAFLAAAGPAQAEQDITAPHFALDALMAQLRAVGAGTARFTETRTLAVATAPLQSSGVLRFSAPDHLEKQTLAPHPALLAIAGDQVSITREGAAPLVVSLQDAPEILGLVTALRATLAGDRATLDRLFTLDLQGGAGDWQLTMMPRDAALRRLVARIRIRGRLGALTEVDTLAADGDRDTLRIAADPP